MCCWIFGDFAFPCTPGERMKTGSTISNIVSPGVGDVTSLTAKSSNTTLTSITPPFVAEAQRPHKLPLSAISALSTRSFETSEI